MNLEVVIVIVVVSIVVIAAIIWIFQSQRSSKKIDEIIKKRKPSAILSHRATFMEGREKLQVALTLTKETIFYENADFDARLDLTQIDEVEYDDETTTGLSQEGHRIIRLRTHGHTFEFIAPKAQVKQWEEHLATHHLDEPGKVEAS
ncbi:MAG: hypothetical protein R3338_00975 [Thermoanaerobaculia bacterium]|nr:hypothetical protein [Thermoanaerobaculia bacterium]